MQPNLLFGILPNPFFNEIVALTKYRLIATNPYTKGKEMFAND